MEHRCCSRRLELLNLVSSIGAYDRVYEGLFEHYLTLHFHDPKLTSVRCGESHRTKIDDFF